jgi:hypothetical protein
VNLSDRQQEVAESLRWIWDGDREGTASVGQTLPEPYTRTFDLARRSSVNDAALVVAALGLRVRVPVYRDGSSSKPSNVLRSHALACRFLHFDAADVRALESRPDFAVKLADEVYALWGRTSPIGFEQMGEQQLELCDQLGGDPSWSASPSELIPLPGVVYSIGGEDVEAVELAVS